MPKYRKNPNPGLPPRAQELARLMAEGHSWKEAAEKMGIKQTTARTYRAHIRFLQFYRECRAELREGELGKNLQVRIKVRDEAAAQPSAAHKRVALEAARDIEGPSERGGVTVNVGVGVQQTNILPGYTVTIPADMQEKALALLKASGSTRSVWDDTKPVIEIEPAAAVATQITERRGHGEDTDLVE